MLKQQNKGPEGNRDRTNTLYTRKEIAAGAAVRLLIGAGMWGLGGWAEIDFAGYREGEVGRACGASRWFWHQYI